MTPNFMICVLGSCLYFIRRRWGSGGSWGLGSLGSRGSGIGFVGRLGIRRVFFGFGVKIGFVWRIGVAVFAELLEGFDGSAVLALGLRLVAEQERPGVGDTDHAVETVGAMETLDCSARTGWSETYGVTLLSLR